MLRYEQRIEVVTASCGHAVDVRLFGWDSDAQHVEKLTAAKQRPCAPDCHEKKHA